MTGDAGLSGDIGLSGADVARWFWADAVAPVLAGEFPRLRYAAGRLGSGSDVLGFDDAMSRDHDWGCRLTVLVDSADAAAVPLVREHLERSLPATWRGQPVRFATTWDDTVSHRVEVAAVGGFARERLGVDPLAGLSAVDWLMLTGQGVLEVRAGPVFADQTSELGRLREILRWYPDDVDRYLLAAGWLQVSYRLPMHGRAADRGDDAGSRVLAGAVAGSLMRLALLARRRWAPYDKWLGTAVLELPEGPALAGLLSEAVTAARWPDREAAMATAAGLIAAVQRDRGIPGSAGAPARRRFTAQVISAAAPGRRCPGAAARRRRSPSSPGARTSSRRNRRSRRRPARWWRSRPGMPPPRPPRFPAA